MRIVGQKSLSSFVKSMLDLILIGGVGIFLTLPVSLKWYSAITFENISSDIYWFLLVLLYVTGAFAIFIVYEIRRIFKSLDGNNPFIMENVKSLNKMGVYSFLISLCYTSKIIFFNSIATMIIVMIFVIAGFFSIILAEVFRQAVETKQENDLTV